MINAALGVTVLWFDRGVRPSSFLRANLPHLAPVYLANTLLAGLLVLNSDNLTFTAFGVLVPVLVFTYAVARLAVDRGATTDALRESEDRFRELAEHIDEVLWTVDAKTHRVLYLSPAYSRVWGQTEASDLARIDRFEHVHEEDRARVREAFANCARHGTFDVEYRLLHPDGQLRWIHDRGFPVTGSEGPVRRIVGIAEDITTRRHLKQELLQARKMDGIGRMAGGVAHDFRNILTTIIGYSQLLLDQLDPRDPSWEAVRKIRISSGRAAELTSQLLAFSRQQVLRLEVIDVNDVVRDIADMLHQVIGEGVEIDVRLGDGVARVKADAAQLEQVVVNLAANARDAMPRGGRLTIATSNRTVSGEARASGEPLAAGRYVVLAVTDTGTGMDERTSARIFGPFFTSKEVGKGTGLGLATVYGTVKQLGGHISVESAPGRGSQFSIYLPETDEKPRAVVNVVEPDSAPTGTETILLVEDEEMVREFVATVLRSAGYGVVEASAAKPALEATERLDTAVDLLVTDVIMPGMSGGELADALKARHAGLPVLFISGYGVANAAEHGVNIQDDVLLEKPLGPGALLRTVRAALDASSDQPTEAPQGDPVRSNNPRVFW